MNQLFSRCSALTIVLVGLFAASHVMAGESRGSRSHSSGSHSSESRGSESHSSESHSSSSSSTSYPDDDLLLSQ